MSGILNIAIQAAYNASHIIQQESRNIDKIRIEKKGQNGFVSDVDKKAEKMIINTIHKAFPNHSILAEESGLIDNNSEFTWIIDPLDGTTNYIHGHPQYAVSIAVKQNDKITHGVILDPNRNDIYVAENGKGAKLNNSRIRVNQRSSLKDTLIATGFPLEGSEAMDIFMPRLRKMLELTTGVRRAGSAALDLAYVAAGMLDAYFENNLKAWDVAAGSLIVREAGGIVYDFSGNQNYLTNGEIIVANSKLITQILKAIQTP